MIERQNALADAYPSAARCWYAVAVLSIVVLLAYTDRLAINMLVDDIRGDLALTDAKISLLQGLGFALIYACCGLPMGRLADRANRRNLILASMATWSIGAIGCGLAHSFEQFFLARMLVGLGEAGVLPAAASMIADSFPAHRRGAALSLFTIGALLGAGVALSLSGWLLEEIRGGLLGGIPLLRGLAPWRGVMIVSGVPGLLLLAAVALIAEPGRKDRAGPLQLRKVWTYLGAEQAKIARVCLAIGLIAVGDYGLLSWLPVLMERQYALGPARVGMIVGLATSVGGVAGCVAAGLLSDWIVRRRGVGARPRALVGSYLFCLAGALMLTLGRAETLTYALAVWVFGSVAGFTVGLVVLQEGVPNEMRATITACSNLCTVAIGFALGPTAVIAAGHWIGGDSAGRLGTGIIAVAIGAAVAALALIATVGEWRPRRAMAENGRFAVPEAKGNAPR